MTIESKRIENQIGLMKDKHIDPQDDSTTIIAKATSGCCGGFYQTIAGALLKSREWKKWYEYNTKKMLYDTDETELIDAMSDEHFRDFMKFVREEVKDDLLKVADKGELEELRAEVIRYFEKLNGKNNNN